MKPYGLVIILAALVAACQARSPFAPNPVPPGPELPAEFFTLSGHISSTEGGPVSGARLALLAEGSSRTAVADNNGEYRFDNVRGRVELIVGLEGYNNTMAVLWVAKNETVNLLLSRPLHLVPGVTLRGMIQGPPDTQFDAQAPSEVITFIPPITADYDLVLTVTGGFEFDLQVDGDRNLYWTSDGVAPILARVSGFAGVRRYIRIHTYYGTQPFEMTATLVTP